MNPHSHELFVDFDGEDIAGIIAGTREAREDSKKTRAIAVQTRIQARRVRSEAALREVLPEVLEPNTSYHCISHGDVDSLSYLRHVITVQRLDTVLISTWVMARPDIEELSMWLEGGRIARIDWYVGEIFPNQYGDEHALVRKIVNRHGGRVVVARNHSKVMAGCCEADAYYVVIESSANVNTNSRIEQTAIHRSEDLYWFYQDFYAGLKSIDRNATGHAS